MRTPEKLLHKGKVVARLTKFSYEFPWAYAAVKFENAELGIKLENLAAFKNFDIELEEQELPESEEEALWEKKRSELGLSMEDLKLSRDGLWTVTCDDGTEDEVRAITCVDGWLQWRA
ncbi:hypothetical protein [Marinobacter sp. CA1]|uniref:hypothetical protein n=1 Tax=Marinobacter sp. CA1 TaxID=2817656 RepID=UPI001D0934DD|nr:hypothetical protein [Marinobacter sp. CA1]UDL03431.1 hypothetical protein J2887_11740 [Marinobacter sp. CA1]